MSNDGLKKHTAERILKFGMDKIIRLCGGGEDMEKCVKDAAMKSLGFPATRKDIKKFVMKQNGKHLKKTGNCVLNVAAADAFTISLSAVEAAAKVRECGQGGIKIMSGDEAEADAEVMAHRFRVYYSNDAADKTMICDEETDPTMACYVQAIEATLSSKRRRLQEMNYVYNTFDEEEEDMCVEEYAKNYPDLCKKGTEFVDETCSCEADRGLLIDDCVEQRGETWGWTCDHCRVGSSKMEEDVFEGDEGKMEDKNKPESRRLEGRVLG